MIDFALKRQLIFSIILFLLIGGFVISGYQIFKSEATCIDGVQNQEEEGIDCGGPCPAVCRIIHFSDIKVSQQPNAFFVDGAYDAVVQIQNPNFQHGTRAFSYTFHFYDENKNIITEKKGTTYLLAGQTRYIIENNIAIEKPAAFVTFTIDSAFTWEEQQKVAGQVALPIFSKIYDRVGAIEPGFAKVTGSLENQSEDSYGSVDVNIVLVDKDKKIIAVGKTEVNNARFHESRSFVVLFPKEIVFPAEIYAEAITNIFDDSNVK